MTYCTKLIERLHHAGKDHKVDVYALLPEAVSAIEALQGEVERLKRDVACHDDMSNEIAYLRKERDALAAELATLKAQEPVAVYHARCVIDCGAYGHHDIEMLKLLSAGTKLYAAPKALAPHEDTKLLDYLQARQATVEILIDGHGLSTPLFRIGGLHGTICADIRGAIGAAIGIGGTPCQKG